MTNDTTVRLSLRELRELPYRALRVCGAGHGEALGAAEAVQFAEIENGSGLAALVDTCSRGWTGHGLNFVRADDGESVRYTVGESQELDLLEYGEPLLDLATSHRTGAEVDCRTERLSSIIDLPLLLAARRTRLNTMVIQPNSGDVNARLATPGGDLLIGRLEAAALTPLELRCGLTRFTTRNGMASTIVEPVTTWNNDQLREMRHEVAVSGREVPASLWAQVVEFAAGFKQPDKEKQNV